MEHAIAFSGHPSVRALHGSTIEVTADASLTPAGDCIVGVGAPCGCAGLPARLRSRLRDPGARVRVTISAGGYELAVAGRGDPRLALSHPRDMVLRRSGYACPRTLAVGCDAACSDVPRGMVRFLRSPGSRGELVIEA